jgi:hypothetical protein
VGIYVYRNLFREKRTRKCLSEINVTVEKVTCYIIDLSHALFRTVFLTAVGLLVKKAMCVIIIKKISWKSNRLSAFP